MTARITRIKYMENKTSFIRQYSEIRSVILQGWRSSSFAIFTATFTVLAMPTKNLIWLKKCLTTNLQYLLQELILQHQTLLGQEFHTLLDSVLDIQIFYQSKILDLTFLQIKLSKIIPVICVDKCMVHVLETKTVS